MKKQATRLIATALALVIAAAGAFMLLREPEKTQVESAAHENIRLGSKDASSLKVKNGGGEYEVTSSGVTGISNDAVDVYLINETLSALSQSEVGVIGGEPVENAEAFGLTKPVATARIGFGGSDEIEIRLGNPEPVTGGYYCAVSGINDVCLLNADVCDMLLRSPETYISLQVTPPCLAASPLSAVRDVVFEGKNGLVKIESCAEPSEDMRVEMLSFGAITHIVRGESASHEVDRTYAQTVFGSLLGMRAYEIAGYGLSKDEFDDMGFSLPDMTVTFTLKNGEKPDTPVETLTVRAVDRRDGSVLIAVDGRDIAYMVKRPAFMDAEYPSFVSRWFFSPLIADLKSLEINDSGIDSVYEIGGTSASPSVTIDGREIDTDLFRRFYTLVVSAAADGGYEKNPEIDENPDATITFRYKNGAKSDDVLALYRKDDRSYYASVNGAAEFTMRKKYLDALRKAMKDLETGEKINTNW